MKKETALSGSVQEKNGKLYAVIGYGDPITKKRKYKWIGLNLTPDAKKSVVKAALRDAIAAFTEQYEKECRGILSPEDCPFLEFLQSWLVNVKKPNVQKSTYDGYEELIERRIRTFFGDKLTLKDITPVRIRNFTPPSAPTGARKRRCWSITISCTMPADGRCGRRSYYPIRLTRWIVPNRKNTVPATTPRSRCNC